MFIVSKEYNEYDNKMYKKDTLTRLQNVKYNIISFVKLFLCQLKLFKYY